MKNFLYIAVGLFFISLTSLIWSSNNNQYIEVKAEVLANTQTKPISNFCENSNILDSSKYECYLQGITTYKASSDKEAVIQSYKVKYDEILKAKEDFWKNEFPYLLLFSVLAIFILIPLAFKLLSSRERW
jgi:hypothetical protein